MQDYETASKTLKKIIHPEMPDNIKAAFETAVEALTKRTPEMPRDKYYAFLKRNEHGHCPSCKSIVNDSERFCNNCGQALDWR